MKFEIVTLFPSMMENLAQHGVIGRALAEKRWQYRCWNPRDFSHNSYRAVDDRPFGGGAGMVMMTVPIEETLATAQTTQHKDSGRLLPIVAFTPQGLPLTHAWVKFFSQEPGVILLCGRYEGFDQRILDRSVSIEISLGDFVISGGELAALVFMDACARLLPDTLGNEESADHESFADGLLEHPHYTRPAEDEMLEVPEVLSSGNHGKIRRWRRQQSLGRTWARRPTLLPNLNASDQHLLDEYQAQWQMPL